MPPDANTVADPSVPPLQETFVCADIFAERAVSGSVIVTVLGIVHRFASVTVTVYVPAIKPVAVAVFCAGVVFQE